MLCVHVVNRVAKTSSIQLLIPKLLYFLYFLIFFSAAP